MLIRDIKNKTDRQILEWINHLVLEKSKEDIFLDYKAQINILNTSDKKELVKDVTAFANTEGGILLIGVPEEPNSSGENTGCPSEEYGIDKIENYISKIYQILEDSTAPRLPNLLVREVCVSEELQKFVYIVFHPKSWIRPHMARGYDVRRFYKRVEDRNIPMEEWEIENLYKDRLSGTKSVESYLENLDIGEEIIKTGTDLYTISATIVPIPIYDDFIDIFDPANDNIWQGRNFWYHNGAHSEWKPMSDGVVIFQYSKTIDDSDYIAKLHPSGAISNLQLFNIIDDRIYIPNIVQLIMQDEFFQFIKEHFALLMFDGHILINIKAKNLSNNLLDGLRPNIFGTPTSNPKLLMNNEVDIKLIITTDMLNDFGNIREKLLDELGKQVGIWDYVDKLSRNSN